MSYVRLGASSSAEILADGTTPATRELAIAYLSQLVSQWTSDLQAALDGKLSLANSTLFKNIWAIPLSLQNRSMVVRSKDQLTQQFLPAAQSALRDYDRDYFEIQDTIEGYLDSLAHQFQGNLTVAGLATVRETFKRALEAGKLMIKEGAQAAASLFKDAVDVATSGLPWWAWGVLAIAGVGAVGYTVRAFK